MSMHYPSYANFMTLKNFTQLNNPKCFLFSGRLLARNLLVPFLLGFKFQLSTLLPIILGLVLLASKKAFFLSKLALLAVTVFSGNGGSSFGHGADFGSPAVSSYTHYDGHYHGHGHGQGHGTGTGKFFTRFNENEILGTLIYDIVCYVFPLPSFKIDLFRPQEN